MRIETSRLILREFQQDDCSQLAPILANPQAMQFSTTGVLSMVDTQAKIKSFITSYQEHGFGKWAMLLKKQNRLVGYCGIAIERINRKAEPELGYRLDPQVWGQGLATEAASACIRYGTQHLELPYLLGIVEPANIASIRVLEKVGMEYSHQTRLYGGQVNVYRIGNKDSSKRPLNQHPAEHNY